MVHPYFIFIALVWGLDDCYYICSSSFHASADVISSYSIETLNFIKQIWDTTYYISFGEENAALSVKCWPDRQRLFQRNAIIELIHWPSSIFILFLFVCVFKPSLDFLELLFLISPTVSVFGFFQLTA